MRVQFLWSSKISYLCVAIIFVAIFFRVLKYGAFCVGCVWLNCTCVPYCWYVGGGKYVNLPWYPDFWPNPLLLKRPRPRPLPPPLQRLLCLKGLVDGQVNGGEFVGGS